MSEDGSNPGLPKVPPGATAPFADAQLYDAEYRNYKRDAGFYRRTAEDLLGGPAEVLELACGTGRVTRELVRSGHHVVGFDYSAAMLRRARSRLDRLPRDAGSRAHLFQGDMRQFALKRRFPLIICAFNSFEHLYSRDEIASCLACVKQHLALDGVFLFDVHHPEPRVLGYPTTKVWGKRTFRDESGRWLRRSLRSSYDRQRQIHNVAARYQPLADDKQTPDGASFEFHLRQRQFFPVELDLLLEEAGFDVALRLGDFENHEFSATSPNQVMFCRPA